MEEYNEWICEIDNTDYYISLYVSGDNSLTPEGIEEHYPREVFLCLKKDLTGKKPIDVVVISDLPFGIQ